MVVAYTDNIGGSTVTETPGPDGYADGEFAPLPASSMFEVAAQGEDAHEWHRQQRRFASLVDLAEAKLRAGEYGATLNALVAELQAMAAESDAANAAMCEDDALALRFDGVVAAGKELRHEKVPPHRRCR